MFHIPDSKSSFYSILLKIDQDAVDAMQAMACKHCGGRLDRADYQRKPRGLCPDMSVEFSTRFSLCCRSEGCRKRIMPGSVRFFDRRVYLMFFILLASSVSPAFISRLVSEMGVSRQTLLRWRCYWHQTFPQTPLWKRLQGRFNLPPAASNLPSELILRAGGQPSEACSVIALLKLLAFNS